VVPKVHRRAGSSGAHNAGHVRAGRQLRRGIGRKALVIGTTAVAASTTFVGTAYAAIVEPPPAPREYVIFPSRDFVSLGGNPAGQSLSIRIMRQGIEVGAANSSDVAPAMVTDADGMVEVNHPGGLCWKGSTPDIQPGDKLVVTQEGNPADGFSVTTQDVTAEPAEIVGGDVVVHGVALNLNGTPMSLANVEQRIINPAFRDVGLAKRDIRATTADGNLVRDTTVKGGFIATHSGLTVAQQQAAVDGETRAMAWQATNAAGDRLGITIYEADTIGGPGFGGCPALQEGPTTPQLAAAQDTGKKGDGITSEGANLTFSGLAGSDTAGTTAAPGPGAAVTLLVDGVAKATGTAGANGVYQFTGVNLAPRAASYAVTVESNDPGGAVFTSAVRRVTVDNAAPSLVQRQLGPTPFKLAGTANLRALYRVSEAVQLTAKVQHLAPQRTVKTLPVRNVRTAGLVEFLWNGRSETNVDVKPGSYQLLLTATDAAGNVRTATARFQVVQ
jgi:hypothetical protein